MTPLDYVAIGVLIFLIVWAVADRFPRGKLWRRVAGLSTRYQPDC